MDYEIDEQDDSDKIGFIKIKAENDLERKTLISLIIPNFEALRNNRTTNIYGNIKEIAKLANSVYPDRLPLKFKDTNLTVTAYSREEGKKGVEWVELGYYL